MSLGDIGISTINGGAIGVKNAIINGNFAVNQRGVSGTVTLAAGAYGHDRFKAGASGCTYTFATANNITTLTISAGSLIQVIEGNNLFTGTYTLSWVGTAQGKIGGGSYASSGVTGTPAGGSNLNIEFNTGTLSLVQFEPGAIATPFERRPYGTELALCQRYYWQYVSGGDQSISIASYYTSTSVYGVIQAPVTMRAKPTLTATTGANFYGVFRNNGANNLSSLSLDGYEHVNGTVLVNNAASGTSGDSGFLVTRNAGSALALSAEL